MTDFELVDFVFNSDSLKFWSQSNPLSTNWPVVYTLSNSNEIYVGETINAKSRMEQHLASIKKENLNRVTVVISDKFNKSACLDLESKLIQYFSADEKYKVLNANAGIIDANYFDRDTYSESFNKLFEELVDRGTLSRPIPELVNSNLFKYSPFKALTSEQAAAVSGVLESILSHLRDSKQTQIVIDGDPGTGKTIVAIYLLKLIQDIATLPSDFVGNEDSYFAEFFTHENSEMLKSFRAGLVVPQQALRATLTKVFSKTPGLNKKMIVKPFEVGGAMEKWDLLIVDEAHRLSMRANQAFPTLNTKYVEINRTLFGADEMTYTQLDWVKAQSKSQVLLFDASQSIKPSDLPLSLVKEVIEESKNSKSYFKLSSQLRVKAGNDYVDYIQKLLSDEPINKPDLQEYDLQMFDSVSEMREAILLKNSELGLCRMLAGYAWEWKSKKDKTQPDIEIEDLKLYWNQTDKDWINSESSVKEVGSIHTIQGYDLNYAGVIIGNDLGFDEISQKIVFRRENYFDKKGTLNNHQLGIKYTDEDILKWVQNIYRVLLTRGIKGTYLYICDESLRNRLRPYLT